ncbi:protease inhibitor Inh/omp19 family protein [Brucella sp. IR073]|uniref:protease inhibitor Inh/omp19 family protein n=1 Tax=unclassified Brucella TaxID=2632610 RepID=UPI003B98144E
MEISRTRGISKAGLMSLAAVAILAAGCQSERMGNLDTVSPPPPPPPLRAAPTGNVQASALPAPGASQFPAPPSGPQGTAPGEGTQMASLPPETAAELTPGKVAGVWTASIAGQTCKIATPQTKFGQGYRAGPLKCPAELANLGSWTVNGKQLALYDKSGGTVATLYSSSEGRFDGQTSSGQAISLSR